MFVTYLSLTDFRSYAAVEFPLAAGVTVFVGSNGQGKTNLVEAIEYLATLGSHRVAGDLPLVRAGAEHALVQARVQAAPDDNRTLVLDVDITPGKANRARINRSPLRRARDLLGALRVVLFSPEDLAIVKGDPAERRAFIDDLVVARWPRLAGVRADYDRVLKQRNTLLKSLSGRSGRVSDPSIASTLDAWDAQLAQLGAELLEARLATLAELRPHLERAYLEIAPSNNVARAEYKPSIVLPAELSRAELEPALHAALAARRDEEVARGVSLVGPHREDITLTLGELPAKGYASHGESWSLALALRLAAYHLLRADGVEPVLILDDVFAELDSTRRERLAGSVAGAEQVLVTAAVASDVPEGLSGVRYQVAGGTVTLLDDENSHAKKPVGVSAKSDAAAESDDATGKKPDDATAKKKVKATSE